MEAPSRHPAISEVRLSRLGPYRSSSPRYPWLQISGDGFFHRRDFPLVPMRIRRTNRADALATTPWNAETSMKETEYVKLTPQEVEVLKIQKAIVCLPPILDTIKQLNLPK